MFVYFLFFFLIYLLIIHHESNHLAEQKLTHYRLTSELNKQESDIAKIAHYQHQLQQLSQEWELLRAKGLPLEQVDSVFGTIDAQVKQSNVSLTHIHVEQSITLTLNSEYLALLKFLDLLTSSPYFLLTDLQLKKQAHSLLTILNLHIILNDQHE